MARAKARQPGLAAGDESAPLLERDGMISKAELAKFLDVPESTLDHWASRGGGPAYHGIGNHKKYLPADVRDWLRTRRREVSSEARGAA
jgi:hypothetical protein